MRLGLAAAIAFPLSHAAAAGETVAFGLTNKAINGTAVSYNSTDHELRVRELSEFGYKGLSVWLGQADSGLFFSPYTRSSPHEDGNFMFGHAFGRVGGIERRISSVYCERASWATFPVTVDFLPLGTRSKTVQIFLGHILVGEETYTNGAVTVSTSNSDSIAPRVNPFWRMPDGSVGVLLEFSGNPPITLPSGRYTYASRIFIRANNPLFTVDHVSRVDIYGGGGLTEFSAIDERLGAFGRAHRALGEAVFAAKKNKLTIANCADAGTDGVLIELDNSPEFSLGLKPVSLAAPGALFQVSASGTYYREYSSYSSSYLGPLGLENIEGEKRLRVDAPDTNAWQARLEVLDGNTLVGGFITTGSGHIGHFGTNDLEIIAAGVTGGLGHPFASLHLQFREPATLTSGPHVLRGNVVRLSTVGLTNDIDTFGSFQILACGVPPFTITNESAAPMPPVHLTIELAGTNVLVSKPVAVSPYTYLEMSGSTSSNSAWHYVSGQEARFNRSLSTKIIPFRPEGNAFFRLINPYVQISGPFNSD